MQFEQLLGCGSDLLSKPLSNSACTARFKPILFQVAPNLSELYSLWITVLAAKQAVSAKYPIFDCEYWHCGRSAARFIPLHHRWCSGIKRGRNRAIVG
jgi:hypothetical protein